MGRKPRPLPPEPLMPSWEPKRILITPEQRARSLRNHEEQVARNRARIEEANAHSERRKVASTDRALQRAAARFLPAGQSLAKPAVLDLVRWPHVGTQRVEGGVPDVVRNDVMARDAVCRWCMSAPADTVDHVLPLSRGGTNDPRNLVGACEPCNTTKSSFLPSELGWVLHLPLRAFDYVQTPAEEAS